MKERCDIGCGCGKSRQVRPKNLRKLAGISSRRATLLKTKSIISPLGRKSAICLSCPLSVQTRNERKKGLRVCHKVNRLINNIIKDSNFICPLGKWKDIK